MIKNKCFEIEHIKKKSQEIKTDPILIERTIYAFELLCLLIERNISLVFKGGTSLMLLIPEFNRVSIDLDIVTDEKEKTLENTFNNITKAPEIFKRWDEDIRVSGKKVPKKHFRFYYDSPIERKELYVLLDILQRKPDLFFYQGQNKKKVKIGGSLIFHLLSFPFFKYSFNRRAARTLLNL